MMEGIGCTLAGLFGTGFGVTSYSENIAVISITKVASRSVNKLINVRILASVANVRIYCNTSQLNCITILIIFLTGSKK